MINLLPDTNKRQLRAARTNVALLRYNIVILIALGLLALLCAATFLILAENQRLANDANKSNIEKSGAYADTKTAAEEYRANLATAQKILNNEVTYTNTVFEIAKLLPRGVILDNLTLNAKDFGSQITLTAQAKNYESATNLKTNFQGSKLFSNVFFQALNDSTTGSAGGSGSTNSDYPIAVSISVKINKVDP